MRHIKKWGVFESAGQADLELLEEMLISWVFDDAEVHRGDWLLEDGCIYVNMPGEKFTLVFEQITIECARAIKEATGKSLRHSYTRQLGKLMLWLAENEITTLDLAEKMGLPAVSKTDKNGYISLVASAGREDCLSAIDWLWSSCRYNIGAGRTGKGGDFDRFYGLMQAANGARPPAVEISVDVFKTDERYSQKVYFKFPGSKDPMYGNEDPCFRINSNHVDSPLFHIRLGNYNWSEMGVDKYTSKVMELPGWSSRKKEL